MILKFRALARLRRRRGFLRDRILGYAWQACGSPRDPWEVLALSECVDRFLAERDVVLGLRVLHARARRLGLEIDLSEVLL